MWNFVGGEQDVRRGEEPRAEEIAECVVFFLEEEQRGVGYSLKDISWVSEGMVAIERTCFGSDGNLFLVVAEKEELESVCKFRMSVPNSEIFGCQSNKNVKKCCQILWVIRNHLGISS